MISAKERAVLIHGAAIAALCFILLRWFLLIDSWSVNMLFWDQWDFMGALFEQKGPWELFSWQHGPHRQGVGFFLTKTVAELSGWNTRAECFMIGAVICLAAVIALFLKRQIVGSISALDLAIPLLYLSPLQFELFANTPNVSHGAMPLLLITLFSLCWMMKNIALRYTACAAINFMTIYTGFGMFIGGIAPLLFLSEIVLAVSRKEGKRKCLSIFFFLVSVASMLSFFIDYTFNSAAESFVFPHPHPFIYVKFILIAFAAFVGIRMSHAVQYLIGIPIALCMLCVVVRLAVEAARSAAQNKSCRYVAQNQAMIVLAAFTLIFLLNLAAGRACLGLGAATASRYVPYLTPGFFSLYLFAVSKEHAPNRFIMLCMACFFFTTFSIGNHNRAYAQRLSQGKLNWKRAYLQTENILLSNKTSGFTIHPNPQLTYLERKLAYLQKGNLNLYLDAAFEK